MLELFFDITYGEGLFSYCSLSNIARKAASSSGLEYRDRVLVEMTGSLAVLFFGFEGETAGLGASPSGEGGSRLVQHVDGPMFLMPNYSDQ